MKMSENQGAQKSFFDLAAWRHFARFYQGQFWLLFFISIGSAAQSLIVLPGLLLIRYAFDVAVPQKNIYLLVLVGIGLLAIRLTDLGVSLWLHWINIGVIRKAIFKLREDLLIRLYKFSRSFHTQTDQKAIHARIVQDTERLSNMSNALVSRLLPSLFASVALSFVLLFLNWLLFLIILSFFPILFLTNRYTGMVVKKKVYVFQRAFERFSKGILFVLRYMDLTKIQSAEDEEIDRQTRAFKKLQATSGGMAFIFAVHSHVQRTLTAVSGIIILIVGGALVATAHMTIGEFISFYIAAVILNNHLSIITEMIAEIMAGNESMVTLHRLVETEDIQSYHGSLQIEFEGFLSLKSVSFSYDDQPLLSKINLSIAPDSKIAIIGSNGAGKSTIIQLILGFYAPCQGELYADNFPYDELDISQLRESMGVVMQNPPFFSGTIFENIIYGPYGIDREQVVFACQYALAEEFIHKLPEGYDTQIGEDGVMLSGGERQRLAIARAILRRPKLLVLDEPTNHLDGATVTKLMKSFDSLSDPPAIVIISHDMSVVNHAREIYQLEKGILLPYTAAARMVL
jgi:ATP-binding cassette subfamily B protein